MSLIVMRYLLSESLSRPSVPAVECSFLRQASLILIINNVNRGTMLIERTERNIHIQSVVVCSCWIIKTTN